MRSWFAAAVVGILLCAVPAAYAADEPQVSTHESLAQRDAEIDASEQTTAQLEAELTQARRLLPQTADGTKRFQLQHRMANIELELATRADNPKPHAKRALDIYHRLLQTRSTGSRQAELLYQSAHAADLAGDIAGGIISLNRLINDYPGYKLIPEAHFRRAEIRFVNTNYALAAEDYSWLLAHQEQGLFYVQSLYKRGWAFYKLGRFREAMDDELAVVRELTGPNDFAEGGSPDLSSLSQAHRVLVEDAFYNITLDFAALAPDVTPADFVAAADASRYEYVFTDNLVTYYEKKGRYADASRTAEAFARRHPGHPQARTMEVRAIDALDAGGLTRKALAAKQAYVNRYGLRRAPVQGQDPLQVPAMRQRMANYLDDITRRLHAAAQDSGAAADYRDAAQWYANYLTVFPDSPRAQELAYRRGDVLYEAQDFASAAEAYQHAAYQLPDKGRGADAAYAAVLALRKAAGEAADSDERVESATLRFAKAYPQDPRAADALARLAEDRYRLGRLQEADRFAAKLVALEPASDEELGNAWRIRAEAAMQNDRYAQAEQAWQWLLQRAPAGQQPPLRQRLAEAMYKRGEALVESHDDRAALEQFRRLRDSLPVHGAAADIRATATYDAAAAAIRAGDKAEGARLLEALRDEYPNNQWADSLDQRLAALYSDLGNKGEALQEYLDVRDNAAADPTVRREAALDVAHLYAETGRPERAVAAYKTYYYHHAPPPDQAIEAEHALIELYSDLGERDKADFWRQRVMETEPKVGTERSRTLAARAALALADEARAAFEAARLHQPLRQTLKAKKDRLQTALDAYGRAADYDIAEVTTAATYHIGDLYYSFSRALLESPRPDDLSDAESARYEELLRQQAQPFEEQAISVHQANVQRAAEGVVNEWVRKSLAQLAELQPTRYSKHERLDDGIVTLD